MVINSREGGATLPPLVLDMHCRTGYGRTHQGGKAAVRGNLRGMLSCRSCQAHSVPTRRIAVKLATFTHAGRTRIGLVDGSEIVDLAAADVARGSLAQSPLRPRPRRRGRLVPTRRSSTVRSTLPRR
jgi:hypothetical protein